MVALASFRPMTSTVVPSRRNFSTTLSSPADGGDVPEMRLTEVDHHPVDRFLEVEEIDELVGRGEEHLPPRPCRVRVDRPASGSRADILVYCATLLAKNIAASSTPTNTPMARLWVATTTTTVVTMTMLVAQRVLLQVGDRPPAEGADRDHDHHRNQSRHRNLRNPFADHLGTMLAITTRGASL